MNAEHEQPIIRALDAAFDVPVGAGSLEHHIMEACLFYTSLTPQEMLNENRLGFLIKGEAMIKEIPLFPV